MKKDLSEELQSLGYNVRGKTLKEIQEIAALRNLPTVVVEHEIQERWVRKPKGIKQILWERGLLDPNVTYLAKVKKNDPNHEGKLAYSDVLADCTDFLNEKTCLMFLGERLGVEVDRSTKCHPEMAGEGIEYSWGRAKSVYRRAKLAEKKGKENFCNLVLRCLSTEEDDGKGCLSKRMVRKFSRRARHYIFILRIIKKNSLKVS